MTRPIIMIARLLLMALIPDRHYAAPLFGPLYSFREQTFAVFFQNLQCGIYRRSVRLADSGDAH